MMIGGSRLLESEGDGFLIFYSSTNAASGYQSSTEYSVLWVHHEPMPVQGQRHVGTSVVRNATPRYKDGVLGIGSESRIQERSIGMSSCTNKTGDSRNTSN